MSCFRCLHHPQPQKSWEHHGWYQQAPLFQFTGSIRSIVVHVYLYTVYTWMVLFLSKMYGLCHPFLFVCEIPPTQTWGDVDIFLPVPPSIPTSKGSTTPTPFFFKCFVHDLRYSLLGRFNPKNTSQLGRLSLNRGEHKQYVKAPPSLTILTLKRRNIYIYGCFQK